jgi:hypothetical protein
MAHCSSLHKVAELHRNWFSMAILQYVAVANSYPYIASDLPNCLRRNEDDFRWSFPRAYPTIHAQPRRDQLMAISQIPYVEF